MVSNHAVERTAVATTQDIGGQVMDGMFTLATFAGFAAGPEGLILSAGATILQQVFHALSGSHKTVSTGEIVQKVLDRELTAEDIRQALASFNTTYGWFSDYYIDEWADGDHSNTNDEYKEFTGNLAAALGPNSQFLTFVNLLQEAHYTVTGFSPFMLGAALHVVLLKIDLILKSTEQSVIHTPAIHPLITHLGGYIDHATTAMAKIDGQIAERLKKIEPVRQEQESNQWVFVDTGNTASNPNGVKYSYSTQEDANVNHDLVVIKVTAQQNLQYYLSRPDKAKAAVKQWKDAKQKYESLLKTSK